MPPAHPVSFQLNSDVVMKSLKVGGSMLCKKVSEILSDSENSLDVVQEAIHFYSRTHHLCSEDVLSLVSRPVHFLNLGLSFILFYSRAVLHRQ